MLGLLVVALQVGLGHEPAPSCVTDFSESDAHTMGVYRGDDGAICFDAPLNEGSVNALLAHLDTPDDAALVVVRSRGGDAFHASRLAEPVSAYRAVFHFYDLCASSCANYLFLPADGRVLHPGTRVLFHGGIAPEIIASMPDLIAEQLASAGADDATIAREQARLADHMTAGLERQRAMMDRLGLSYAYLEDHAGLAASAAQEDCIGDGDIQFTPTADWMGHYSLSHSGAPFETIRNLAERHSLAERGAALCPMPVLDADETPL